MRASFVFASLSLLLSTVPACDWLGGGKGADGSSTPSAVVKLSPAECAEGLEEIRKIYKTIPDDLRRDPVTARKLIKQCTALLQSWSKQCDYKAIEGGSETLFMSARLLLAGYEEFLIQLKSDTSTPKGKQFDRAAHAYLDRVIKFCQMCLESSKPEQTWYVEALDLEADIHLRKNDFEKALTLYRRVTQEFPNYREIHKSRIGASRCLWKLRRPEESLTILEKAIDTEPDEFRRLMFMRARWKPLLMTGELQRLADYLDEMEHLCRTNMESSGTSVDHQLAYMRHLAEIGYRRTIFVLFPLGKFQDALAQIRKYVTEIPVLQARAKKIGKNIASLNTYQYLSGLVESILANLAGKKVRLGLDQVIWAGNRQVSSPKPNDKITVMVFHSNVKQGDNTANFIQSLDHFARDNADKLELCWLSRQATDNPRNELNSLRDAASRLQLTHTALGVDADYQNASLFKRFHAPLLSGSVVIVDKSGRVVFQYLDPRWLHIGLTINTIRQYF